MRLGINQPNFLPYIGYISLIKHTDLFILFDTVQFERHSWMERNRILKQIDGGWQYVSVPLEKHKQKTIIKDIRVNNDVNWKKRLFKQLQIYTKAPNYTNVINLIKTVLNQNFISLVELDKICIEEICRYLKIDTPVTVFSEMNVNIQKADLPDEWALNICKAIPGATEYWNLLGGQRFFDGKKYETNGIELKFMDIEIEKYRQFRNKFEERLSILDVMMFNDVETINRMLDQYKLMNAGGV